MLSDKTKIVSVVHVSNTLGTINPVEEIIEQAHKLDIPVLLDACQSVPHMPVDISKLDCDFLVFSGHKLFGPTGIGVLWGKREWLENFLLTRVGRGDRAGRLLRALLIKLYLES